MGGPRARPPSCGTHDVLLMAHRVALRAEADLDDIWLYVAKESGSIEIANRLIDTRDTSNCPGIWAKSKASVARLSEQGFLSGGQGKKQRPRMRGKCAESIAPIKRNRLIVLGIDQKRKSRGIGPQGSVRGVN